MDRRRRETDSSQRGSDGPDAPMGTRRSGGRPGSSSVWRVAIAATGIGIVALLLAGLVSCAPNTSVAPFVELHRIERADIGFAIRLPLDWEYSDAIEADPESWWEGIEVGNVSEFHDQVLTDGAVLLARRVIGRENCILYDFTARAAEPPPGPP